MGELSYTVGGDNNLVSFKSAARVPITSLKAHFKPKQDLHGYSKPWPAGGGNNIWDEEFEFRKTIDFVYTSDNWGNDRTGAEKDFVSKNYIPVISGQTYYGLTQNRPAYAIFYDSNKNPVMVSEDAGYVDIKNRTFTAPSNASYMRFYVLDYSPTYGNDIAINYPSTVTTYSPYSNICSIEGWDNIETHINGINLLNKAKCIIGKRYASDGTITNQAVTSISELMPVVPNSNYYILNAKSDGMAPLYWFDKNKKFLNFGYAGNVSGSGVVTSPANAGYLGINISTDLIDSAAVNCIENDESYHPYEGYTIPITFPVLGKNKFNWDVEQSHSAPTGSDPSTLRSFTLDTYVVGMSINNYYRDSYTNWVLNPSVENGVISFGSGAASGYGIVFPLSLIPGQTYFISGTAVGNGYVGASYYDKNGSQLSYQYDRLNKTITIPKNTVITLIGFYASTSNASFSFSNIQLELGSTATTYEPYDPNNTVYGGYADVAAGELVAEYGIKQLTSADYIFSSYTYENKNGISIANVIDGTAQRVPGYCTHTPIMYQTSPGVWSASGSYTFMWLGVGNRYAYWVGILDDLRLSTVDEFKNWLDTQNVYIAWKLLNPIHYSLSSIQLQTLLNQNNIWSNTNDITEVSYAIHDTAPIRAAKHRIAANEPHIETVESSIAHFETDMITSLKECKVYFAPKQDTNGYGKVWIGGCGKNLFDENSVIYNTWTREDGTTYSTDRGCRTPDISVSPGDSYVVNYKGAEPYSSSMIELDENKNFIIRTHASWNSTSSDSPLCVTLTENTRYIYVQVFNKQDATITPEILKSYKIQLEKGSVSTSYEPYENICPIEGWTDIVTRKTKKNIVQFKKSLVGPYEQYQNGYFGWINEITYLNQIIGQNITFSAYIDATNVESGNDNRIAIWGKTQENTWAFLGTAGNNILPGSTGISKKTITIPNNLMWLGLGYSLRPGATASNPMVEIGNEATEYEQYNGATFPIIWGKNLLNVSNEMIVPFENSGADNYTINNNMISVTDSALVGFKVKCEPSTQYTFSYTSDAQFNMEVAAYTEEPTIIKNSSNFIATGNAHIKTFTTPADTQWLTCGFYVAESQVGSGITINDLQLELGSSKTEYAPYICGTVYGGYIDLKEGKLIQTHKCITLNGSEYWGNYYTSQQMHFYLSISDKKIGMKTSISSSFPNVGNDYFWDNEFYCQYGDHPNLKNIYVNAPYKMPGLVTEWKAYLAEHPMQLCYELATPIEHSLTPAQLKTLRGQNNIWSNSNGNISIQYYKRRR